MSPPRFLTCRNRRHHAYVFLTPHFESGRIVDACRCSGRLFRNRDAYLDWIPTTTLGMAPSMTLSIALEMLLGIERRIFLQQRLRPDERSNAHVSCVSALFLGTEIPMSRLLKLAVSRWGVDQDASFAFRNRAKLLIQITRYESAISTKGSVGQVFAF